MRPFGPGVHPIHTSPRRLRPRSLVETGGGGAGGRHPLSLLALLATLVVAAPGSLSSQERADASDRRLTAADYSRAEAFLGQNAQEMAYGLQVSPNWIDGEERFWYRNRIREGHEFVVVDAAQGDRARAFDHVELAAALSRASDQDVEPFQLPFQEFEYLKEDQVVEFTIEPEKADADRERWRCERNPYECTGPLDPHPSHPDGILSPDGRYQAFIRDHDLWLVDTETGEERQLTSDGQERYGYATDSQGWRRTATPVLVWSPDSRMIATYRLDERDVEEMHLLEMDEPRPQVHSWPYAVPGDSILPMHERVVVHVEEGDVVALDHEPDYQRTSSCCGLTRVDPLTGQQKWADVRWSPDGESLAFASTSRDYRTVTLHLADPHSGDVQEVHEEDHPQFFLTNIRSGGIPNWRILHDRGEFLWFSERDGWGHLFRYHLETGEEVGRVTGGDWNVVDVLEVDEAQGRILFTGVGREEGVNPYFPQLYAVNMDGTDLTRLTPEDLHHTLSLSPSGAHVVSTGSTPVDPPVTQVRRTADGGVTGAVEEGDVSALEEIGWEPPKPFTARGRDGVPEVHGLLYLPSDFDPSQSYPMVNSIYPGPQTGSIGTWGFDVSPRGHAHALAELGFVVVQVDAPGTPFRSKAFHAYYYGDMGDNGLEDQKRAMQDLGDRHEWIDLDRAGIYGHSGGGFATAAALLRFPDFFKVGVSSAGNHDNRGYTDYWGERWQGPLEAAEDGSDTYEDQANHLLAENLEGRLLLSYGTMDANVHPNTTLLLIDRLIEHNHDFDVMVFPNRGHGYAGESYKVRMTWDYFVTHLLEKTPPAGYRIGR